MLEIDQRDAIASDGAIFSAMFYLHAFHAHAGGSAIVGGESGRLRAGELAEDPL